MDRRPLGQKIDIKAKKNEQLNQELPDVADTLRNGDGEPGKVNLREEPRIGRERIGSLAQAGGKVIPNNDSRHVKEERRDAVRWKAGDLSKDDLIYYSADERLYKVPKRPNDRLLVQGDENAP